MRYVEVFSPKIKNKTRSNFTDFIQYCSMYPSYCNKQKKRQNLINNKVKLLIFVDTMIICVENPKQPTNNCNKLTKKL